MGATLRVLSTAIAIAVGVVVLLSYFVERIGGVELKSLQVVILNWATTLAAVALLVGVVNLVRVHAAKIDQGNVGSFYSTLLVLAFVVVLGLSLYPPGPAGKAGSWVFRYMIAPVEAAIGGMIFFFLVFAGYRLMRLRRSPWSLLFVAVSLFVLVGLAPLNLPGIEFLASMHNWIVQVPAVAGSRGILLGVALGTIATGLRVLMAADRPYGE